MNTHVRDNLNAIASPPYAYIRGTNPTTFGSGTSWTVGLDTEVVDTDSMFSTSAGARLTINTSGVYLFSGGYSLTLTSGTIAKANLYVNGAIMPQSGTSVICGSVNTDAALSLSAFWRCSVGDYIELGMYTSRSSANTIVTSGNQQFLQGRWMGP
jgi:hypothetical protein